MKTISHFVATHIVVFVSILAGLFVCMLLSTALPYGELRTNVGIFLACALPVVMGITLLALCDD